MTLEDELPDLFHELAAAHPVGPRPELSDQVLVRTTPPPRRSPVVVWLAAAACVALVVGGLAFLSGRDAKPAVSDQPAVTTSTVAPDSTAPPTSPLPSAAGEAIVLAPPAGSSIRLISARHWGNGGIASGAVVAPDGTVFSISVGTGPTWLPDTDQWDAIPSERRALDTIAGRDVAAMIDGSAPGQIYRTVRDDCWSIELVTADAPMWSGEVTTFISAITPNRDVQPVDDYAVTVDVPDGWTSLGAARFLESWTMELQVDIDGTRHDVHLAQRPNAPVGVLLSGESNPVPFDHNGRQWWAVDIVTTPGMTSVIGDEGFGAFHIASDLTTEQLVEIIDELTPTAANTLSDTASGAVDTVAEAVTEISADTIAAAAGTGRPGTQCGELGSGLDLIDP